MKIRILKSFATKRKAYGSGEVVDLPAADAKYFVREGLAEIVKEEKKPVQKPVKVQQVKKTEKRPVTK